MWPTDSPTFIISLVGLGIEEIVHFISCGLGPNNSKYAHCYKEEGYEYHMLVVFMWIELSSFFFYDILCSFV